MKLFYLSQDNLKNANFVKDLVHYYKHEGKGILLHASFGAVHDTRFVTKRISALFSENMVVNNAVSGDQRNLLAKKGQKLSFRAELVSKAFETVQLFILNSLVSGQNQAQQVSPYEILQVIRQDLPVSETIIFPSNPKSPLIADRQEIINGDEIDRLLRIYEEETAVLELARELAPVTLAAPPNFLLTDS